MGAEEVPPMSCGIERSGWCSIERIFFMLGSVSPEDPSQGLQPPGPRDNARQRRTSADPRRLIRVGRLTVVIRPPPSVPHQSSCDRSGDE